ncbi:hypothetical protein [Leptolyngbya ohadii]|uniref:hypothetical protein n=1 Tax=Leptolyngbya ohadii TaxID=1962290 RepID=UPI000B59A475|nr:hypothetical protein [Leptolyngbya ohadii]
MPVKQAQYEELLAEYSDRRGAIELLKLHRPYLEMIPSMRRPDESVMTLPLPLIRIRKEPTTADTITASRQAVQLPCDLAILMCDPEWRIKTGGEIIVFIHRPNEDFSDLLSRWRRTQILLDTGYEWVMAEQDAHLHSEGSDENYPLFALFPETPDRIRRGLRGANLPYIVQTVYTLEDDILPLSTPQTSSLEE